MTSTHPQTLPARLPPAGFRQPRLRLSANALFVLGLTSAVVLALCIGGLYAVWNQWQAYEETIASQEPRIARLAGIYEARGEIATALEASRALAAGVSYPHTMDSARVASELQNRVRDVFQGAGMSITGSQQVAPREAVGHEVIGLIVNAQGELPQLVEALRGLQTLTPRLRMEQVTVRSTFITRARARNPAPQRLTVEVRLTANRLVGTTS